MIGSDGAGNPICLATQSGAVVMLDHEDYFKTKTFVNSSVAALGECLLAIARADSREDALSRIREIDAAAANDGAFWVTEDIGFDEEP